MNWPWVSRLAYDVMVESRDHERTRVDTLLAQMQGAKRMEAGFPERGWEQQQHKDPEWMTEDVPDEITDVVEAYGSVAMQDALMLDIRAARRADTPWEEIYRLITKDDEDDGDPT